VTLDTLGQELTSKCIYHYKRSSLAILITYRKDDNRRALMEKPHVTLLRKKFLKDYMDNLNSSDPRPCIYLDETWVFANDTVRRSWQDEDVRSIKKITGEGGTD
jgi:hypothetical protein